MANSVSGSIHDPLQDLDDVFMDELLEERSRHETASAGGSPRPSLPASLTNDDCDASDDSPTTWKAVHMELQENAKIPTFLQPVNREGSSGIDFGFSGEIRPEDFLNRHERHLNFRYDDSEFLDLAASIDPTPLSELKGPAFPRSVPLPLPSFSAPAVAPVPESSPSEEAVDSNASTRLSSEPLGNKSASHASKSSRPSLEVASSKRNQYGFGATHSVPSVPRAPKRKASALSTSSNASTGNNSEAYERKKQRAKDARVKLNESIEQLSIAIGLAGTQTKQRSERCKGWPSIKEIMDTTVEVADGAKKWDRPSFVGSAAELVHSLNSQCEALMKYIEELQGAPMDQISLKRPRIHHSDVNPSVVSDHSPSISPKTETTIPPSLLLSIEKERHAVSSDHKLLSQIFSYLDPVSLGRCELASRQWKSIVDQDDIWKELAIRRFGYYNYRQWKEKIEDTASKDLYRNMDEANIMPHMSKEGLTYLGEARLSRKVSAWTFLVNRSNGETLRSAKRDPAESREGSGTYTSLPIVELRTVVQNTWVSQSTISLCKHEQGVDSSTRRRGEELKEVTWDDRFRKRILKPDGSLHLFTAGGGELCRIGLYETVVVQSFIHAKACSTISKFVQKANFTQILVRLGNAITVPVVIPFPREHHDSQQN